VSIPFEPDRGNAREGNQLIKLYEHIRYDQDKIYLRRRCFWSFAGIVLCCVSKCKLSCRTISSRTLLYVILAQESNSLSRSISKSSIKSMITVHLQTQDHMYIVVSLYFSELIFEQVFPFFLRERRSACTVLFR